MSYIATTFAHGNGPYSRCVEWAVEVNNAKEKKGLQRLPIAVPLVYQERQKKILKEELGEAFISAHPDEILFDAKHGELLSQIMFKGSDYSENLRKLYDNYYAIEAELQKHLEGKRELQTFDGRTIEMDLRDAELQLGLNNRMQTGLPNQFYTAGGAGPFDEVLIRAIADKEIKLDKEIMQNVLPIARRMIENQKIIFSNEPGVFSYDSSRKLMHNERLTPPFVHVPEADSTNLPWKGIYLLMTGIDGVRESGMYNAAAELGMNLFAPSFSISGLPESIRSKVIPLDPKRMNNPSIVAQYARAGWISVWISHLSEKGFITPAYNGIDDPEMLFNLRGIEKLGLGVIMNDNPQSVLERATKMAEGTHSFNEALLKKYGTLDGITYSAEIVFNLI